MSTAPVTAIPREDRIVVRLRHLVITALFMLVSLLRKLPHIRQNVGSWLAFRILLGFAGAALVLLPLSYWSNWLVAPAGLCLFLASILLPPAKPASDVDEKSRELASLTVVSGGNYQRANAPLPVPVRLFVGIENIFVLDSRLQTVLVIPAIEITSASATREKDGWILRVRWPANSAEFSFRGIFAEHLASIAQTAVAAFMHAALPALPKSRAASA